MHWLIYTATMSYLYRKESTDRTDEGGTWQRSKYSWPKRDVSLYKTLQNNHQQKSAF